LTRSHCISPSVSPGFGSLRTTLAPVLGKRSRPADDYATKSKLAQTAPSSLSKLHSYLRLQENSSQRIWDDRPCPDPCLPISLLFAGFGEFLDAANRLEDEFHLDAKRRKLRSDVDFFAEEMTKFYEEERDRRKAGLSALNKILSYRGPNRLMAAAIGSVNSDGHYDGPLGVSSCVVGFKKELCDITSMPMVELIGYVAHSYRQAILDSSNVFQGRRVPCLGLTIVGTLNISDPQTSLTMGVRHIRPLCNVLRNNLPRPMAHGQLHVRVATAGPCMLPFLLHWSY